MDPARRGDLRGPKTRMSYSRLGVASLQHVAFPNRVNEITSHPFGSMDAKQMKG